MVRFCMGGPVGSNETRVSRECRYLYGKINQETLFSSYGGDLAKTGAPYSECFTCTAVLTYS